MFKTQQLIISASNAAEFEALDRRLLALVGRDFEISSSCVYASRVVVCEFRMDKADSTAIVAFDLQALVILGLHLTPIQAIEAAEQSFLRCQQART